MDDLCRPLFDFNPTETQIHSLSVFRRNLPSPNKRQQLVAKDDLSVKKRTTEKLGGQGGVVGTISSSSVTTRPRSKSSSAASLLSAAANAHHIVYPTPIHTPAGSNTPAGSTSPMKGVGGAGGGTLVGPTFTIPTYHHQQQPQQQFPRPLNQHSVRGAVSSALVASSLKFSHMSDLPSTCEEMDEERTTNSTHFMNSNSSNLDVEDNMMVIDVDETSASSSFSASSNSSVAPSVAAIKQPFYVVYEKDNAAAAARNGGQTSSTIAASTSPHLNHTTMHHHNHLQQQHLREQSASALLSLEQIPVIEMEDVLLSIYLSDDPSKLRAFFHYRLYSNSNSASIPASTSPSSATTSILPSPLKHTPSAATTARVYRQILETKLDMAGNTLLHWACILGRRTILQSLIYDYGANLSILNNQGQTPLITAVNHTYNYTFQTFPDLLRLFDRVVLEPSDCSVATGVMINGGGGNDAAAVASSSSSVSFSSSSSSSSSTTPLLAKHIKRRKEEQGRTILHHIVELGSIKGKVLASRYYLGCLAHWIDESLGKLDEHRAQAQEERDRRQNEIEAEIHRRRTEARMAALQAAVVSSSRTNRGKVPRGGIIASIESLSPTRRQEIIDQVDATLNQTLRPLTSTLRQTLLAAVSSSLSSGARAPIARKSTAAISTFLDRRCKRLGDTALHRACVVGDPEIIHWLISLGTW